MTEAVLNKYGDCFRRLLPVLHASFPVQHPSDDSIVQTNFLETAKMQLNQMSSDTRKLRLFPFSAGRAHHLSTLNERVAADSAGQKNHGASFPSPDTADFLMRGGLYKGPLIPVQLIDVSPECGRFVGKP